MKKQKDPKQTIIELKERNNYLAKKLHEEEVWAKMWRARAKTHEKLLYRIKKMIV